MESRYIDPRAPGAARAIGRPGRGTASTPTVVCSLVLASRPVLLVFLHFSKSKLIVQLWGVGRVTKLGFVRGVNGTFRAVLRYGGEIVFILMGFEEFVAMRYCA